MKTCPAAMMLFASAILRRRSETLAFRLAAGSVASRTSFCHSITQTPTSRKLFRAGLRVKSSKVTTSSSALTEERPRKGRPHPRNSFQGTYDMPRLVAAYPRLGPHVAPGPTGRLTVDWADPAAVRALNAALLAADYGVRPDWAGTLPPGALVPPVPGRADYVHHLADALADSLRRCRDGARPAAPVGPAVTGMDVGAGASCIYPLLASSAYGWRMVASDVDPAALAAAREIVESNDRGDLIDVRRQASAAAIFDGVLGYGERLDFTMCNPPFYPSREAFRAENARKLKGLARKKGARRKGLAKTATPSEKGAVATTSNNFGGMESELCCEGGEVAFVRRIISESRRYSDRCLWFSSLVSRKENVPQLKRFCCAEPKNGQGPKRREVRTVRSVPMGAGQKSSTILMWSFWDKRERQEWANARGWG